MLAERTRHRRAFERHRPIARRILPGSAPFARVAVAVAVAFAFPTPARAAGSADASTSCAEASEQAQRAHLEHRLLAARRGFRACSQSSCARFIRADCETALREVEDKLPTVVIAVRTDSGEEVTDATVWLDGARADYLRGVQLELDPGLHTVLTRSGTGGEGTLQIVAREGEKNRTVSLVVPRPLRAVPTHVEPVVMAPKRTAEKVLGGVGVGLVLASAAFDIAAYSRYHSLESSCGALENCARGDVNGTADLAVTGDVLLGVGLATVAAAVLVYLVRGPSAPPPRSAGLLSFPLPE